MTTTTTAPHAQIDPATTLQHEHAWLVESRHPTSEGRILYVRCSGCRAQRIDLQGHADSPPHALSRCIRPASPDRAG